MAVPTGVTVLLLLTLTNSGVKNVLFEAVSVAQRLYRPAGVPAGQVNTKVNVGVALISTGFPIPGSGVQVPAFCEP